VQNSIIIKAAREHNLKNIDVTILRVRFVVTTDRRGRRSLPE
jgi:excinuclease UvrABC ATPase subunit